MSENNGPAQFTAASGVPLLAAAPSDMQVQDRHNENARSRALEVNNVETKQENVLRVAKPHDASFEESIRAVAFSETDRQNR